MDLKLAKLPDRMPVKIAITVSPQLGAKLNFYAELYNALYPDSDEATADLIPYMLENFLEADRNFTKAFKEHELKGEVYASPPETNRRKRRSASNAPHTSTEE